MNANTPEQINKMRRKAESLQRMIVFTFKAGSDPRHIESDLSAVNGWLGRCTVEELIAADKALFQEAA